MADTANHLVRAPRRRNREGSKKPFNNVVGESVQSDTVGEIKKKAERHRCGLTLLGPVQMRPSISVSSDDCVQSPVCGVCFLLEMTRIYESLYPIPSGMAYAQFREQSFRLGKYASVRVKAGRNCTNQTRST
jgi:hypothetical protein